MRDAGGHSPAAAGQGRRGVGWQRRRRQQWPASGCLSARQRISFRRLSRNQNRRCPRPQRAAGDGPAVSRRPCRLLSFLRSASGSPIMLQHFPTGRWAPLPDQAESTARPPCSQALCPVRVVDGLNAFNAMLGAQSHARSVRAAGGKSPSPLRAARCDGRWSVARNRGPLGSDPRSIRARHRS